jgi:hypothetical protein
MLIQPSPCINKQAKNCKVISLPTEVMIIKNVIGNYQEIPQVIYQIIQDSLCNGQIVNAVLKWRVQDAYYWVNSMFIPGAINYFRDDFKIETNFLSPLGNKQIKKLYKVLVKIEQNLGIEYSKKYLEGYLEEKGISFNDLPSYLNKP